MASGGDEHRMVFDIRGKRRHVVKVVYAILALLMGLSLFLVTGAVNLGTLFGGTNSTGSAVAGLEEQTERLERKVRKEPENADLLMALARAQINVANQLVNINETAGVVEQTPESRAEIQRASSNWSEYLKATDKPSPAGAQIVAQTLYNFAYGLTNPNEIETNFQAAADAQQIVVDSRADLNSLSTLAIYRYFAFEDAAATRAGEEAKKLTTSKFEREKLENLLEEESKTAHLFQKESERIEKASKGAGKEQLENPFGGLGGG